MLGFSKLSVFSQQASQQYFVSGESDAETAAGALTGRVHIYHGASLPEMRSCRPVAGLSDQTLSLSDVVQPPFKQTSPGGKKNPKHG